MAAKIINFWLNPNQICALFMIINKYRLGGGYKKTPTSALCSHPKPVIYE
jgi:hypothetical protein